MDRIIVRELNSTNLNRNKKIRIFLPIDYYSSDNHYPVLYMHDGQNLNDPSPFSNHSWEVLKTMDDLFKEVGGVIIVGIDNSNEYRIMEYSNYLNRSATKSLIRSKVKEIKPEGNEYGHFIVEELKPIIDKEFRTKPCRENTFIAGSSCGGNISIYLGVLYQDTFSVIGAFSPAYYIVKNGLYEFLDESKIRNDLFIYHDMGTKENGIYSKIYFSEQKIFHDYIVKKLPEKNVCQIIDEGATHSEKFWAIRFRTFLKFCIHKMTK